MPRDKGTSRIVQKHTKNSSQQLSPHLCAGNNVEFQFLVHQAGACL